MPMLEPMAFDLHHALRYLVACEGSDLHLKVPAPPMIRLHGELEPIQGSAPLTPGDTEQVLADLLPDDKLAEFERDNELDFSYQMEGVARFRVNAFRQRGFVSLVMRAIPVSIKSIDELNLPPVIRKLAEEERGIILLTGTTGSGKSTTLAAMIDHMNRTMAKHIVTIEDPIEFLHPDRRSVINQREIGQDTADFKRALKRVLRQDPDVILVGEMRDEETVQTALSAAETGHLVLSTLHTVDATEAINRIIDFFPPHHQQQARAMIAGTMKGVISQRLVKTADGGGRVATCEILTMTGRVHDMILDAKQTGNIHQVISEGEYYGMQTFDQHLLKHVQAGRITTEEAMRVATSPHDFKLMLAADGRIAKPAAPAAERPAAPPVGVATAAPAGPAPASRISAGPPPSAAPPGF
jgi:twitching motility protein PilT